MNHPSPAPERPWQPRFTLFTLFLVMAVIGVASAGGYYLMEALRSGLNSRAVFVLFTLASPVLTVILVSLLYAVYQSVTGREEEGPQ